MPNVLILGNGISRLSFVQEILDWKEEIWACNRAYIEFGARLSRIAGHTDVMIEAQEWKEKHGLDYQIYGGHIGRHGRPFTCDRKFWTDSGTTLVGQALHEGYDVHACGFDLGGMDVLSPGIENQNKTQWVTRWRQILATFGQERVTFWGYDHKPYLLSTENNKRYADRYLFGRPHIPNQKYLDAYKEHTGKTAHAFRFGGHMVRVRFHNGYESELREAMADRLAAKGELVILEAVKQEQPELELEAKKEPEPVKVEKPTNEPNRHGVKRR